MKKQKMCKILFVLAIMVALAVLSLAILACEKPEEEHTEHTYGEWTVVTKATCTTVGSKEKVCSGCEEGTEGHKVKESIPEFGHDYDEGKVTTPATCTEKGVKTFTCANDRTHIKTEDVAIDANAHDWDVGTILTAPTYNSEGERAYECEYDSCDGTTTKPIAAKGIPTKLHGVWVWPQYDMMLTISKNEIVATKIKSGVQLDITAWDGINEGFTIEFDIEEEEDIVSYVLTFGYVEESEYDDRHFSGRMSPVDGDTYSFCSFYAEEELAAITVVVNNDAYGKVSAISYWFIGTTMDFFVTPEDGYVVESVFANGVELHYSIIYKGYLLTPDGDVTIEVTFVEEPVSDA